MLFNPIKMNDIWVNHIMYFIDRKNKQHLNVPSIFYFTDKNQAKLKIKRHLDKRKENKKYLDLKGFRSTSWKCKTIRNKKHEEKSCFGNVGRLHWPRDRCNCKAFWKVSYVNTLTKVEGRKMFFWNSFWEFQISYQPTSMIEEDGERVHDLEYGMMNSK